MVTTPLKKNDLASTAHHIHHRGSVAQPLQSRSHGAEARLRIRVTTHFLTQRLHELIKGAVHPKGPRAVGSQISWVRLNFLWSLKKLYVRFFAWSWNDLLENKVKGGRISGNKLSVVNFAGDLVIFRSKTSYPQLWRFPANLQFNHPRR